MARIISPLLPHATRGGAACLFASALLAIGGARPAAAALPVGNSVQQWNQIAENTVVGSGAFQNEGLIYMGYVSAAVYNASVAIGGGYKPYGAGVWAPDSASIDAAVVEAAYDTLVNYFPSQAMSLYASYTEALGLLPDGISKANGQAVGLAAATSLIQARTGDGRLTPIGVTSAFPKRTPGPGVWRLTPPAYAAPQTPWVGAVRPFILESADQFLPEPPPALTSPTWVHAFNEIELYGSATSTVRSDDQTATAKFWTANVIRQANRLVRDLATQRNLSLVRTARLAAMVNVIAADAQISVMYAKYHYLNWRPVSAIDPTSVALAGDGFGPVPGFDDGNAATVEQVGWRPLITTPNHPEYPAAHGSFSSSVVEVLSEFLDTDRINIDVHGFDPAGAVGNLDAVRHFDSARSLRRQIVDARFWAGLHYRFSGEAGIRLGREVAEYDLRHAFRKIEDREVED
jgi:hypothetical protein